MTFIPRNMPSQKYIYGFIKFLLYGILVNSQKPYFMEKKSNGQRNKIFYGEAEEREQKVYEILIIIY